MSLNDAMLKVYIFLKNNEGASGIEYAIIAAMVAVVLAGFTTSISGGVEDIFEEIQKAIGLTTS
ncbi:MULTISPECIES: Flp family type IVb pilin [Pseudomonas]|uniref:Flp family type IVb pilin n=1 Tax=Pseudomonas TaxID=286 RepID=UPI000C120CF2|nr:Flp family type IVb pilin [Pseudomonadaceae bacterium]HCP55848.1 Flp family type IVb pilin [Pseudomonas sp.]